MNLAAGFSFASLVREVFAFRWRPGRDLLAVAVSWLLVTGSLWIATHVVGSTAAGGMAYFALYGVLAATVFGVGLPLYWTVVVRRRPISDLGITMRLLGVSLVLQVIFAALQFVPTLARTQLPPFEQFLPLVALALAIGFFEAVFWRGWVQLRLEDAFGIIPGILLGAVIYALYHVGYGMPLSEISFLFLIGVIYAVIFRLTKSVFILWPLLQPMGQLVTLVKDGLTLPVLAALGFIEVLALMVLFIWLAHRYYRKHGAKPAEKHALSLA
jgi:membrane protease YdiL (CAAX protease family)